MPHQHVGWCCPQAWWAVAKAEAKAGPCALWKLDSLSKNIVESGGNNCFGSPADLGCRALTDVSKAWPPKTPGRNPQPRVTDLQLTSPLESIPQSCARPAMTQRLGFPPRTEHPCPVSLALPWGRLDGGSLATGSLLQLPPPALTGAQTTELASLLSHAWYLPEVSTSASYPDPHGTWRPKSRPTLPHKLPPLVWLCE
jgi:hypothetical protein